MEHKVNGEVCYDVAILKFYLLRAIVQVCILLYMCLLNFSLDELPMFSISSTRLSLSTSTSLWSYQVELTYSVSITTYVLGLINVQFTMYMFVVSTFSLISQSHHPIPCHLKHLMDWTA